jgi:Tfp pilus assembly protein FimV
MTAISLPATSSAPTRLRLTQRGRRVFAGLAALPAVVAVSVAVLSGGGALATADAGAPAGTFETVTVAAGESLWAVAQDVAPEADPRDVVAAIIRLNGLGSAEVSAGQRLAIPLEYAAAE